MQFPKPFFVLLFSIAFTAINSQELNYEKQSIVEYFDGSIFICELLEAKGSTQPVVLASGDTLILNLNLVKMLRKSEDIFLLKQRKFHFKKGTFFDFKFGFNGGNNSGGSIIDLGVIKKINPRLNLGLGFGLHYNSHNFNAPGSPWIWIDSNMIPIYFSGQYYLSKEMVRTYVSANLGYASPIGDRWNNQLEIKGGFHGRLGFGIEFASRRKTKLFIEVYQHLQQISGTGSTFGDFGQPINYDFNLLGRKIGLVFGMRF